MQLSARNQLKATVDTVTHGEVMSTVRVTLPDGAIWAGIVPHAAQIPPRCGVLPGGVRRRRVAPSALVWHPRSRRR